MKWPMFPLDKIADVFGGSTPRRNHSDYWDGDIPWVTPTDLPMPGTEIADVYDTADHITPEGLRSCAANLLPVGTVLYSSRATIGKIGIARVPLATNQGFANFAPKPGVESKYLAYALQFFTLGISSLAGSTTFKEVRRGALKKYKVPLPSPSEQRRIVEILDQADALRKKRTEADAKAARILPALFYKMFGDPATNPKRWTYVELTDVISDTRNGLYKPSKFYGSGIGILKMFNIKDGELNLSRIDLIEVTKKEFEAYQLIPGDILINRVNTPELVGKCAIITDEVGKAVFESKNIRIRVKSDRVTPEYVASYINSPFGHAALRSGVKHAIGMATINNTDLRKTLLPLPPIELQQKWAETVIHIRSLRKATVATGAKLDLLFNNLLFQAFTGDLTSTWRETHMKELLAEMEEQAKVLDAQLVKNPLPKVKAKSNAGCSMRRRGKMP
jgi:type I restriction enzyme S subunit